MALLAQVSTLKLITPDVQALNVSVSTIQSLSVGKPFAVPSDVQVKGFLTARYDMVVSTMGNDPIFITEDYLGKKAVLTTSNFCNALYLPDPVKVGQGWNFLFYNDFASSGGIDVYDDLSNYLFTAAIASTYPLCSDGIRFLNF
jgi:hypothetical protein